MLYVSSQICHGRLIIFQPGADTDVWHDVFLVFVWACWRLVPHRFGTECWIFLWQDVGKESSLLTGLCIFFVRLTVTVGFGPVDGWFLTGPNSKMERVEAGNNHFWNRMLVFFLWQDVGKESSFFWLSVQAGNKSRLEQNAGFFFVARGWERVQSFDWAMHFCLVRLTVGPYR